MKICYWDDETKSQKERDMTQEELAQHEIDIAASAKPQVPKTVSRKQGLQALFLRGLLDQIPLELAKIADPIERRMAQIEFDDATEFNRHNWLVLKMGQDLNLDLDDFFIFASSL